jgi:subtilisin family serine protease
MDWFRSRVSRRRAGLVRVSALGVPELLEGRRLLSASQADGMDAVASLAIGTDTVGGVVERIDWNGRGVDVRIDHWNGRYDAAATPFSNGPATLPVAADWRATQLGNGFFSLVTPNASRKDVLAWAAGMSGLSLEPDFVLGGSAIPNDPGLPSQWVMSDPGFGASQVWDVATGSRGVVVGVIDSGVDISHPDLAANIWTNPGEIAGNGLDDDHNGYVDDIHGWNFVENNNDVRDGYGHGTHVAGIVGAVGNNGMGVTGINWQVSIMPLRFQNNSGLGFTGEAIAAINYATMMRRDHGINIVVTNNSWSAGIGVSSILREAVRLHGEAGITLVAAAGNGGANCDASPWYPGSYDLPNVLSVAAIDDYGNLTGFSNYGAATVDLGAPGVGIYSTLPNGSYGSMAGTSMAAPHVTGVVALLASAKPGITVAEVRSAILGTTAPLPSLAGRVATGGRLDAGAALESLSLQSLGGKARIAARHSATGAVEAIAITFTSPVAAGFELADVKLTRNGAVVSLENATLTTSDGQTWSLGGLSGLTCGIGGYSLLLADSPAASGIAAADGELLQRFAGVVWTMDNRLPIGLIESATPVAVTGWAADPNAGVRPITVQLWVRGKLFATVIANREGVGPTDGGTGHRYAIKLPSLPFGSHRIEVRAVDIDTGTVISLGTRVVAVMKPVGVIEAATSGRISGWAFSSRAGESPIILRIQINGRTVGYFQANGYRPELRPVVGSDGHGYEVAVDPALFRRAVNTVKVHAVDPLTGKLFLIGTRQVRL